MEKVAACARSGEPARALLSLATGAGKTFIAANLLRRIPDAGKQDEGPCSSATALSSAPRPSADFQNVFGSDAAEVYRKPDGVNDAKNARVHIATYQTLGVASEDGDASFLKTFYPDNYFSHIVIDECHRSAWGKWSEVLTRNRNAVQIGLTATPRQLTYDDCTPESRQDAEITANNLTYFGEPVYEYNMTQAMEDGYLAGVRNSEGPRQPRRGGPDERGNPGARPVDSVTGAAGHGRTGRGAVPEPPVRRSDPAPRPR